MKKESINDRAIRTAFDDVFGKKKKRKLTMHEKAINDAFDAFLDGKK